MSADESSGLPMEFRFLVDELGFRLSSCEVSPYFGNSSITLVGDSINVRVSRDRGIVDVEVSPSHSPEAWKPLELISQIIPGRNASANTSTGASRLFEVSL